MMARFKRDRGQEHWADDGVMPLRLVRYSAEDGWDASAQRRAQREWLRARGVDPADTRRVLELVNEAKRAHGIPTAHDRVRRLVEAGELRPAPRLR